MKNNSVDASFSSSVQNSQEDQVEGGDRSEERTFRTNEDVRLESIPEVDCEDQDLISEHYMSEQSSITSEQYVDEDDRLLYFSNGDEDRVYIDDKNKIVHVIDDFYTNSDPFSINSQPRSPADPTPADEQEIVFFEENVNLHLISMNEYDKEEDDDQDDDIMKVLSCSVDSVEYLAEKLSNEEEMEKSIN